MAAEKREQTVREQLEIRVSESRTKILTKMGSLVLLFLGAVSMLDQFQSWINEIAETAIERKRADAQAKGDERLWESEIWKSPTKNRELKHRFEQEGSKLGYESRPSKNSNEWLYDFVWLERNSEGFLIDTVMAMEIELAERESKVVYDYEKLLQADCPYRVMFFQFSSSGRVNHLMNDLRQRATYYHFSARASFLLAGWATGEHKVLFDSFTMESHRAS